MYSRTCVLTYARTYVLTPLLTYYLLTYVLTYVLLTYLRTTYLAFRDRHDAYRGDYEHVERLQQGVKPHFSDQKSCTQKAVLSGPDATRPSRGEASSLQSSFQGEMEAREGP